MERHGLVELTDQLRRLEHRLDPLLEASERTGRSAARTVAQVLPAWRRVTYGEPRWPVTLAVVGIVALQLALPKRFALTNRWTLPAIEVLILAVLIAANPVRVDHRSFALRVLGLLLIAAASLANAWSAARLIDGLVHGSEGGNAAPLLITGGNIWLTNVIIFALWYWELDRGGPGARVAAVQAVPDFLFPQMASPQLDPDWEPQFVDYLYVSFTNATAFSPTDTMPLSRWAKLAMLTQSGVSLCTVALVIARAVNIFR